jgi:hypothetical protein
VAELVLFTFFKKVYLGEYGCAESAAAATTSSAVGLPETAPLIAIIVAS